MATNTNRASATVLITKKQSFTHLRRLILLSIGPPIQRLKFMPVITSNVVNTGCSIFDTPLISL